MTKSAKNFVSKSEKIHGNKYDYSFTEYIHSKIPVKIICSIHGEFAQQPKYHLSGAGCTKCGYSSEKRQTSNRRKIDETPTLAETLNIKGSPNNRYSIVRNKARRKFKHLKGQSCQVCGYDKHIEFCHIKAIASFSENTIVSTINSKENIAILCPNCHWEFDNGLLIL